MGQWSKPSTENIFEYYNIYKSQYDLEHRQ